MHEHVYVYVNTHMYMCISLADLTLCPGRSILGAIRTNTTDTALVGDAIRWTNLLSPIAWCTPHGGAIDRSRCGIPNPSEIGVLMWRVPMWGWRWEVEILNSCENEITMHKTYVRMWQTFRSLLALLTLTSRQGVHRVWSIA